MNAHARVLRCLSLSLVLAAPVAAFAGRAVEPTCRADRIDARSYALTTRAVAMASTEPRLGWWEAFDLGSVERQLDGLNDMVTRVAARALEIDPGNLLGHQILARQYLVLGDAERAQAAWSTVFAAGGAVAWTATLYDVDVRTYFLVAFDARGIRIYRFDQVVDQLKRGRAGIPEFPGPDDRFWAADAGCIPSEITPDAEVPWSAVREIKAGNWVLWFRLDHKVEIGSDRTGQRKALDEIKLNLHGRAGTFEVDENPVGGGDPTVRSRGPADYQDMVRRTIAQFVDPERRLSLPPVKPGLGW